MLVHRDFSIDWTTVLDTGRTDVAELGDEVLTYLRREHPSIAKRFDELARSAVLQAVIGQGYCVVVAARVRQREDAGVGGAPYAGRMGVTARGGGRSPRTRWRPMSRWRPPYC